MSTFLRTLLGCLILVLSLYAQADSIGDILSPGDLIQGHIKVDKECAQCHKKFDKAAQPTLCKDCHKDIAKDITEIRGYHVLYDQYGIPCIPSDLLNGRDSREFP